ncbi:MAG TPA: hypothetical protein VL134_01620 [Leptolyngbya sp.]|jgi:hypothetical protein|nr:hypothetical protein [Leptolyngbya sp.]
MFRRIIESSVYSLILAGLGGGGFAPAIASQSTRSNPLQPVRAGVDLSSEASTLAPQVPDNVRLYGQSPQPNQIGQTYLIVEFKQGDIGDIVGALYAPRSSFDCATGSIRNRQLKLTATEAYSGESYPVAIAMQPHVSIAASTGGAASSLDLQGLHRISTISQNDLRILNTCKTLEQS